MRITNLEALKKEAEKLIQQLHPGDRATLITLSGELGAGKTTFTQALAEVLGIDETVTSPTFVLEKIYALPTESSFHHLVHIDAYRLNGGSELSALGFIALMEDPGNLIVLEWPERVADALPQATVAVTLVSETDGSRLISYA
ncbi:MAG: tRNA (adenosine(37)-N6)-threonylcarbamoyltransferase complex ATPase subunit type 1 TsaE [Bacillota bacterium]